MSEDKQARIRELNDQLRREGRGGRVIMTNGAQATADPIAVLNAVKAFDDFTEDNDPFREHDFGALYVSGNRIFWKIDYYSADLQGGSDDPSDPEKTARVLTIMLAGEY